MARIQRRADKLVRKVFRRGEQNPPKPSENISKIGDKLERRRAEVLKRRRGL